MNLRDAMLVGCYQQAKTIHRLLLVLADDLGDLSVGHNPVSGAGEMSDLVSGELEPKLQAMRDQLERLTR